MLAHEVEEICERRVCAACVGEAYLRAQISRSNTQDDCSYCDASGPTMSVEELADRVEGAFARHYERTSTEPEAWEFPMLADSESGHEFSRKGEPVTWAIANAAVVDEDVADDVQAILEDRHEDRYATDVGEECEFDGESYYEEKATNDREWREAWDSFEKSLKTEARFFSRTAAERLAALFDGLEAFKTNDGRQLVVEVGPGGALGVLYRARVFQSDEPLKAAMANPDTNLGPPPSGLAVAGRMNAAGIAVFYGATSEEAAIAEVRPPVGAKILVGKFEPVRPLRLLDLTALADVQVEGSIFDPAFAFALERASFLRSLSRRMARAVMPDDAAFEYLATQAVADFLATEAASPLDGIIFPSAQLATSATNVVLFHKSSRVEVVALPKGVVAMAYTGQWQDGGDAEYWEPSYEVWEREPPPSPNTEAEDATASDGFPDFGRYLWSPTEVDPDGREMTLRVSLNDLMVHEIKGVSYTKRSHHVRRVRPAAVVRRVEDRI